MSPIFTVIDNASFKHDFIFQVPYSITGWLDKNKDPLNETVTALFSESKEPLVGTLFEKPKEEAGGGKKKGKSSAFQTISSVHRVCT